MTEADATASEMEFDKAIPVGSPDHKASGWFGMWMLIVTEAALFLYLLFTYYYLAIWNSGHFLPPDPPSLHLAVPNTALLLASSVAAWWAEAGIKRGQRQQLTIGLLGTVMLGVVFIGIQVLEWLDKPFRWDTDTYGSLYYTITGFHMAHVAGGVLMLLALLLWNGMGFFDRERHAQVSVVVIYWHFVDAVWLTIFFTFYITPFLS